MGPKSQWFQCIGVFSSCTYCIKILLLLLQWYTFAKQPGVSVYLLLKLKHSQVGKFDSESQEILLLRVALTEQPRAGRLLLCPSPSCVLGRKRCQKQVSSVSPSRSRIITSNPVALLKKQKSECVTSAMSPKFLLIIKQNERAIQSHWSCCGWELPMQHWLLPADGYPLQFYAAQVWKIQYKLKFLGTYFTAILILNGSCTQARLWMRSICPDPIPIVKHMHRMMRHKAANSKRVTWVGCVSHFHALSWEFTGTYCTE